MLASLIETLFLASLAGTLGVVLVLVLRLPFRRVFGPRIAYAAWIIPAAMIIGSLLPTPAALSIGPGSSFGEIAQDSVVWIAWTWLAGAVVLGLAALVRHGWFMRRLGKPNLDAGGLPIMRAREDADVGPAVVGAISPRIVVPANFDDRYSEAERAMVLAHERAHLFGHDVQAIAASVVVRCLNWFNPLAHLGSHYLRIDQELACDASVLAQYPNKRRTYAEALLKTQFARQVPTFGCQWPAKGNGALEQRIALLAAPERSQRRRLIGGWLVAIVALAAAGAVWAAEAPRLFERPAPVLQLWAMLKDDVAYLQRVRPKLVVSGGSLARSYEIGEGTYWDVTLSPVLKSAGDIVITADIVRDGRPLPRQIVTLEEGEPRIFRLGDRNLLVTARVAP